MSHRLVIERPVYSEVMEDYDVISQHLNISSEDVVLSISSAGDNVLNAAMDGPRLVLAVDISQAQVTFGRLKTEMIRHCDWSEFASLMGAKDTSPSVRAALLERGLERLGWAVEWKDNFRDRYAEGGLVETGALPEFLEGFRAGIAGCVGEAILREILNENSLRQRESLWAQHFDTEQLRSFLNCALKEENIADAFIPSWAFDQMLEGNFAKYYYKVMRRLIVDNNPTQNPFLHRMLLGSFPKWELPRYMLENNFEKLRCSTETISWHCCDVLTLLRTLPDSYVSVINMSNVLDWYVDNAYDHMWSELSRVAKRGARLFLRSFVASRELPRREHGRWCTDQSLNTELFVNDKVGYFSRCERWIHT